VYGKESTFKVLGNVLSQIHEDVPRQADTSREALEKQRQQYQDIRPPKAPAFGEPSSASANFAIALKNYCPKNGGVEQITPIGIKWTFLNAGCKNRSEAVKYLMDNPAVFSHFDANTNQMLIDTALNTEPLSPESLLAS
jgi:hypothetical protein